MQGYQLTFFTQQDRRHGWTPLGEWLLKEARNIGIGGATLIAAAEGFGQPFGAGREKRVTLKS